MRTPRSSGTAALYLQMTTVRLRSILGVVPRIPSQHRLFVPPQTERLNNVETKKLEICCEIPDKLRPGRLGFGRCPRATRNVTGLGSQQGYRHRAQTFRLGQVALREEYRSSVPRNKGVNCKVGCRELAIEMHADDYNHHVPAYGWFSHT